MEKNVKKKEKINEMYSGGNELVSRKKGEVSGKERKKTEEKYRKTLIKYVI